MKLLSALSAQHQFNQEGVSHWTLGDSYEAGFLKAREIAVAYVADYSAHEILSIGEEEVECVEIGAHLAK